MTPEEKQRHYAHVAKCRRENEAQRRAYEELTKQPIKGMDSKKR